MSAVAPEEGGGLVLRLTLPDGASLAQGCCLIGVVTLEPARQVEVNARLNLVEGDLRVDIHGPSGAARIGWPWPADAGPRRSVLAAGERLIAAVPLISTDTSQPAFPAPGSYRLVARYSLTPAAELLSAGTTITRGAGDPAATRALEHRDVLQSLLSAGVLGNAASGLRVLAQSEHTATRTLARLALGEPVDSTSDDAIRAVAALFPPHASSGDPRRDAALTAASEPALRALFTGMPA